MVYSRKVISQLTFQDLLLQIFKITDYYSFHLSTFKFADQNMSVSANLNKTFANIFGGQSIIEFEIPIPADGTLTKDYLLHWVTEPKNS